jgi:hypothetical protein
MKIERGKTMKPGIVVIALLLAMPPPALWRCGAVEHM